MEKRVLFFFALVTLSFFLIQNYISPSKTNHQKSTESRAQEQKEIVFVPLYKDRQQKSVPVYGIPYSSSFFVFGNNLPATLYYKEKSLQKVTSSKDSLSVYSQSNRPLFIPTFSKAADIELLTLGEDGMINKTQAHFDNGLITDVAENTGFSLCFHPGEGEYLPLGVYESNHFTPLQQHEDFQDLFQVAVNENRSLVSNEEYYVIESPYQQLVFSNIGGSIAEINLPFPPPSVVKEIQYDKIMESKHPENDYFPLFPSRFADSGDYRKLGGYYPLLRRDILNTKGQIQSPINPRYHSMNIIGDGVENIPFQLNRMEKGLIEFTLTQPHRRITKTYYFPEDFQKSPYIFNIRIQVEGDARNLWITSGVPEVELISGSFNPAIKYNYLKNGRGYVDNVKLPKEPIYTTNITPNWMVNSNGFFGIILDPLDPLSPGYKAEKISGEDVPTKLSLIDAKYNKYPVTKYPGYEILLPLSSNQPLEFRVFAGPFEDDILSTLDRTYSNPTTGYSPDYSSAQSLHGYFSFITAPFAKFMFFIMKIFHSITGSWGLSIILITVVLRLMLYPLNSWSIKTQAKSQLLQPKLKALQERYKKDPKKLQMETMKLYKESGVNPFMGCFPLLIQMPFLFAMFNLLKSTFELRGATFIPGWIDSLTSPDVLFSWGYPIIFIGNSFHLLPILLGAVMYFQQRYTLRASGADMSKLNDQQRQQVATGNIMVAVFTVLFYHLPSGLNLYWLFSSLLGIAQQHWLRLKGKHPSLMKTAKK